MLRGGKVLAEDTHFVDVGYSGGKGCRVGYRMIWGIAGGGGGGGPLETAKESGATVGKAERLSAVHFAPLQGPQEVPEEEKEDGSEKAGYVAVNVGPIYRATVHVAQNRRPVFEGYPPGRRFGKVGGALRERNGAGVRWWWWMVVGGWLGPEVPSHDGNERTIGIHGIAEFGRALQQG
ncbi:hypothetical protein CPAR01_14240 [Colletotrichum paranaense]|uniref:Uncharacterized protein n=1 Tax=Colletotrichum paranaense TaxID=1914294 RepID=A0ABQ9S1M2_9PEZI|nr:uncharacterized protein CPAR01_14240 [Colletotrichum paranaense]KAK1522697.1 hypothetical protein CPAR01_14240 [Colletotrichum paranaense]